MLEKEPPTTNRLRITIVPAASRALRLGQAHKLLGLILILGFGEGRRAIRKVDRAAKGLEAAKQVATDWIDDGLNEANSVEQLAGEVGIDGVVQQATEPRYIGRYIHGTQHKAPVCSRSSDGRLGVEVDVENTANGFCDCHGGFAPVPSFLWNTLGHVRVTAVGVVPCSVGVGLGTVEGCDGTLVGDAAVEIRPVREEARDEVVCTAASKSAHFSLVTAEILNGRFIAVERSNIPHDNRRTRNIEVELLVGSLRGCIAVLEVFFDGVDVVRAAVLQRDLVHLLEQVGLEAVVVSIVQIEVEAGGRRIPLVEFSMARDARWRAEDAVQCAAKETDPVVCSTYAHLLCEDIASVERSAHR